MNCSSQFVKHTLCFAMAVSALVLSSCTAIKPNRYSTSFDPPLVQPTNPSAVHVRLSTGAQRVYVMEGNRVLLASPCSVGTTSAPTPHGRYTIYTKTFQRRRHSQPGAGYPMTYWMEFKPAYGMHWGFVPTEQGEARSTRLPSMT